MNSHKNSRFDGNSANFDSYRTYTRMRRSNFYFYENRNGILQIGESVGYDVSVKFGTGRWRFNSIPRVSHSSILRATDTCRRELRPDLRYGRTPQLGILDIGTNMVRSLGHIRAVSSNVFLVSTSNRLVSSAGVWPGILISHVCAFSVAGRRCLRIVRPVPHGDTGIDRSYGGPRKYFNSRRRKLSWIHCVCYT